MGDEVPGDVHVVVFDVNVYLDVAGLLGAPFTWEKFHQETTRWKGYVNPSIEDRRVDSLRALAVCQTGVFAGRDRLEVWTSAHIDDLVFAKATQPTNGGTPELRGLGWSQDDGESLVQDLVYDLVFDMTAGATVGQIAIPHGNPPLSHEDGCVLRTALEAGEHYNYKYCVTQDRDFRLQAPSGQVTVLHPHEWVDFVRKARKMVYPGPKPPQADL